MNERIRELVLEAQTQAANETIQNSFGYEAKVFEKFAELIVAECVGVVEDAVNHREPASTYVGKIREHFGVE